MTATLLNAHLRDNLNQTFPGLVTTKGDSVWATGANAGQRVAVGANGQFIAANSACTAGVAWDATLRISGSKLGLGTACPQVFPLHVTATNDAAILLTDQAISASTDDSWLIDCTNAGVGAAASAQLAMYAIKRDGTSSSPRLILTRSGQVLVNTPSGNANMTTGVVINQGGFDDEILTLKSSDVAHSFTGTTEQSTYGLFKKEYAADGALRITGLSAAAGGGAARSGLVLEAYTTNTQTVNNTSSSGIMQFRSWVTTGASTAGSPAGADNAFAFVSGSRTCVIIDGAGELQLDAGSNASAFDHYVDAALLRSFAVHTSDPTTVIQDAFVDWMRYQRDDLERLGLVQFNDGPGQDGHAFYNLPRLVKVLAGNAWQEHTARRTLEERVEQLEAALRDRPPSEPPALATADRPVPLETAEGWGAAGTRPADRWARVLEIPRAAWRSAVDRLRRGRGSNRSR